MEINQCLQNYKMSEKEIRIPNIGDFQDVEVIEVLISNGQEISINDPLITIESDKSSVEIPATTKGKIKSLNIKVGDKVSEGDLILVLENNEKDNEDIKKQPKIKEEQPKTESQKETAIKNIEKQNFNIKSEISISPASPKARKFARELGVDINQISGSERKGRVVEEDVKSFISSRINKVKEN